MSCVFYRNYGVLNDGNSNLPCTVKTMANIQVWKKLLESEEGSSNSKFLNQTQGSIIPC